MTDLKKSSDWAFENREKIREKSYAWVEANKDKHKLISKIGVKRREEHKKTLKLEILTYEMVGDVIKVSNSEGFLSNETLKTVPRYVRKTFKESKLESFKANTYYDIVDGTVKFFYTIGILKD